MSNNKIIHVLITILSMVIVYISTNSEGSNKPIELYGNSKNWNVKLTIKDNKSNLTIEPKELILNDKEDIYYSYNLYKDEEVIVAVRYDFLNYKNPIIEKRVSVNEVYEKEEYEIEIECNDIREVIDLNKISG